MQYKICFPFTEKSGNCRLENKWTVVTFWFSLVDDLYQNRTFQNVILFFYWATKTLNVKNLGFIYCFELFALVPRLSAFFSQVRFCTRDKQMASEFFKKPKMEHRLPKQRFPTKIFAVFKFQMENKQQVSFVEWIKTWV